MSAYGRKVAAIAIVASLACTGAACGASSGGNDARTVIVSAASKSEAASTFNMTVMFAQDIPPPGKGPAGLHSELSGEFDLSSNSFRETLTMTGVTVTVIQIGNDWWQSGTAVPPGKWAKEVSSSTASEIVNPARLFLAVKSQAATVRFLGAAEIDGVSTEHYQFEGPPSMLEAVEASSGGTGFTSDPPVGQVTVEVWVDNSTLIRRMTLSYKTPDLPGAAPASNVETLDFSGYGQPAHIQPPPTNLVLPSSYTYSQG